MSFQYPLGLLGLIGVPILIIIYLLKNKYTEQIIASTYLWELSEKFLKRKKQKKLLSGLISLILQIIAVVTISLLVAHPVLTVPSNAKEYCFVLDGSGSMNTEIDDVTRFELGKDKIEEIIVESTNGSKFTLIYAGENTRVMYDSIVDKDKAIELLNKLSPTGVTVDYKGAISYVQEKFNENKSLVTYLVTDREYNSDNINVINVSNDDNNFAIVDLSYNNTNDLKINGKVISYKESTSMDVEIYVDDTLVTTEKVIVSKNEPTSFEYIASDKDFKFVRAVIKNDDGLLIDNTRIVYNIEKEHGYTALLVSENPFYLETVIETLGNISVTTISPNSYSEDISGYSLYIYDSFNPGKLPSDGTVWIFGVETSITGSGFSVQDVVQNDNGYILQYPKNSTTLYKELTKGLTKEQVYVNKYVKYGLYRNFTTLFTIERNPVVFTGTTDKGNREVVFGFDLHNSNFPLLLDYLILVKNLINYSFPVIMDKSAYTSGDNVLINILSNFDSVRVDTPNGNVQYLDVSSETSELTVNEVGVYTLTIMSSEETKEFSFYVSLPEEESKLDFEIENLSLQGELEDNYIDGIYDKLIILFIILSIIFVLDWVVYCYEQYLLR